MSLPKPNRKQLAFGVIIIVALAIVAGLMWAFAQQLALARQIRAEQLQLEQAVATEKARNDELVAQLDYVRSDEYVEHWARAERKMAHPGEVVVIVVDEPDGEAAADVQPTPATQPKARPFWVDLWELVFAPSSR